MAQKLEETFEYGAAKEIANEIFRYTGIDRARFRTGTHRAPRRAGRYGAGGDESS